MIDYNHNNYKFHLFFISNIGAGHNGGS